MTVDREASKRKNLRNKYPLVVSEDNSVQEQNRQSLTAGAKLLLLRQERKRKRKEWGKKCQCSFCRSPNPPTTKNNATLQWATVACYIIAMSPQQAKGKKNAHILKKKKIIFSNMIKRLDVNSPSLFRLMHFACFSGCLHCPAHSLGSSECKSIMVETKL